MLGQSHSSDFGYVNYGAFVDKERGSRASGVVFRLPAFDKVGDSSGELSTTLSLATRCSERKEH